MGIVRLFLLMKIKGGAVKMKITENEINIIQNCPTYHKFYKHVKTGLICFRVYQKGSKALIDSGFIYDSLEEAKRGYRIFMDNIFDILDRRNG